MQILQGSLKLVDYKVFEFAIMRRLTEEGGGVHFRRIHYEETGQLRMMAS